MSSFESIFDSKNKDVDPALNKLFSGRKSTPVASPTTSKKTSVKNLSESAIAAVANADTDEDDEEETKNITQTGKSKKGKKKFDAEAEGRTIFVGNVDCSCKKEDLTKIFRSFGKIECVRFRNIVSEDLTKSKKYSFITKQLHPNRKTLNAFVRFDNKESAKSAATDVNGMEFKGNHLRVDIATQSKVHDNKKSVFLGALPFDVNDEDIYQHFNKCGPIEFVRIIRDNKTGIGKGFGYVQFKTADSVTLALKLAGSSLNERKIRVDRCVKKQKASNDKPGSSSGNSAGQKRLPKHISDKLDKITDSRSKKGKWRAESEEQSENNEEGSAKRSRPKFKKPERFTGSRPNTFKKKTKKPRHISTNRKEKNRFNI